MFIDVAGFPPSFTDLLLTVVDGCEEFSDTDDCDTLDEFSFATEDTLLSDLSSVFATIESALLAIAAVLAIVDSAPSIFVRVPLLVTAPVEPLPIDSRCVTSLWLSRCESTTFPSVCV